MGRVVGWVQVDGDSIRLGKVNYDAELTDFAWPRRLGLGGAYRVKPSFLIATDVDWIDWSAEDHITAGFGVSKTAWTFDLGLEYVLESEKTNNRADPTVNPFGPGSRETLSQFMADFMVRRSFP